MTTTLEDYSHVYILFKVFFLPLPVTFLFLVVTDQTAECLKVSSSDYSQLWHKRRPELIISDNKSCISQIREDLPIIVQFKSENGIIIEKNAYMPSLMCLVTVQVSDDFPLSIFKPSLFGF